MRGIDKTAHPQPGVEQDGYCYDIGTRVLEFLLEIPRGFVEDRGGAWRFLSGGAELGGQLGRAFLIAATVTRLTPAITASDRFNTVGHGVLHGVK